MNHRIQKIILTFLLIVTIQFCAKAQLKVGDIAPEIKLPDTLGKWCLLSNVKSKVILIDFWAAWCYPCVQSMPDVVKMYEKYRDKGLAVYAVSLDKGYYNWIDMCRKLKLPFILVNEVYGFEGKSCKDYKVNAIPHKLLIKDGKVIASEMSLYDIDKMLEKELSQ